MSPRVTPNPEAEAVLDTLAAQLMIGRLLLGLTQNELSTKLRVSPESLSCW